MIKLDWKQLWKSLPLLLLILDFGCAHVKAPASTSKPNKLPTVQNSELHLFFVDHDPSVHLKLPNEDTTPLSMSNNPQQFPPRRANQPPGNVYNNLMTCLDSSINNLEQHERKINGKQDKGKMELTQMGQNSLFDDLPPLDDPAEEFKQLIRVKRNCHDSESGDEIYQSSTNSIDNSNQTNTSPIKNENINQTVTIPIIYDREPNNFKACNSTSSNLEPYENDDRFMSTVEEMIELIDQQLKNKTKNILKRIARQDNMPMMPEHTDSISTLVANGTSSTQAENVTTTTALLENITTDDTLQERSTNTNILEVNSANTTTTVLPENMTTDGTLQKNSINTNVLQENSTNTNKDIKDTLQERSTNTNILEENSTNTTTTVLLENMITDGTLQENSTYTNILQENSRNTNILEENITNTNILQENRTSSTNNGTLHENSTSNIALLANSTHNDTSHENSTSITVLSGSTKNGLQEIRLNSAYLQETSPVNEILQENSTSNNTDYSNGTVLMQENITSIANSPEEHTIHNIVFLPEYVTRNILQEDRTTVWESPKQDKTEVLNTSKVPRTLDPLEESEEHVIISETDSHKTTITNLSDHQIQSDSSKNNVNTLSDNQNINTESVKVFIRSTGLNGSEYEMYEGYENDTVEHTEIVNPTENQPNRSVAYSNSSDQYDNKTEMAEPEFNQTRTEETWFNSNESNISNLTTSYLMSANTTNGLSKVKLNEFYIKKRVPVYPILTNLKSANSSPTQNRYPFKSLQAGNRDVEKTIQDSKMMENLQTSKGMEPEPTTPHNLSGSHWSYLGLLIVGLLGAGCFVLMLPRLRRYLGKHRQVPNSQ